MSKSFHIKFPFLSIPQTYELLVEHKKVLAYIFVWWFQRSSTQLYPSNRRPLSFATEVNEEATTEAFFGAGVSTLFLERISAITTQQRVTDERIISNPRVFRLPWCIFLLGWANNVVKIVEEFCITNGKKTRETKSRSHKYLKRKLLQCETTALLQKTEESYQSEQGRTLMFN